jgi:hypothetical protein
MSKRIIFLTIGLLLLVISLTSFNSVAQHPGGDPGGVQTGTITITDYNADGSTWEDTITEEFDGLSIESITFDLSWTDDEGSDSQSDSFSLQTDDDIQAPKSGSGSGGSVSVSWDDDGLNNVWNIAVTCDSAGPTQVPYGPLGLLTQQEPDPGNSWTLVVTYSYTEDTGGMGGPPQNVIDVLNSPIFKVHIALMIASTYLFLGTGIIAGIYLFSRTEKGKSIPFIQRHFSTTKVIVIIVILAFIAFFLAAVPIGMWVAGGFYGWTKAWTGFPALWNPEAFELTNADNVSFIVLLLWAIPVYFNRRPIVQSKWYKKFFGWSKFLMARAEKAPNPKLQNIEFAISYFFMGFFVYLVFMVQPHGSG